MQARPLRRFTIALLAALAAALSACASGPPRRAGGYTAGAGVRQKSVALPGQPGCFWLSDFEGSWTVLNDSELIIEAPFHHPYLIRLFEPVPTLRLHERLGFADIEGTGRICNGSMDDLVVPHWQPHRIPIVAVRELTVPQERQLLAKNHITPPPARKPAHGSSVPKH